MAAASDEGAPTGTRNGSRGGIPQRVKINRVASQHGLVQQYRYTLLAIVDEGKRRHRSGLDPQHLTQKLGPPEAEPSTGADHAMEMLQFDRCALERHQQPKRALFAFEKKVLGVRARDVTPQTLRFLHREQWRMRDCPVGDPKSIQIVE